MGRRILPLVFTFLFLSLSTAVAQSVKPLTNADVIKMLQAGLDEGTVIEAIAASNTQFDGSLDALIALHQAGATDKLIQDMVNAQSPQPSNVQPAGSLKGTGTPLISVAPQNPLDSQATALAKQVLAGGPGAREPLLTAMRLSGFNVRNLDGSFVLKQPSNATPIGFQSWQVDALAEPGRNLLVSMGTLTSVLNEAFPVLSNVPLSVLLVQGIRTSATSRNPQERFWAQFIMALEHIPPDGYDLNSVKDPSQLYFDMVQTAFILHRLVGDVEILALADGQIVLPSQVEHRPAAWESQLQNVAFRPGNRSLFFPVPSPQGGACNLQNELQENIVDLTASNTTVGFDVLMDYLKEHIHSLESETGKVSPLEGYQNAIGAASVLMEYAKLLAIYAKGLHVTFKMDENGPPLIRTHSDTDPGEQRIITATASLQNLPNIDWINCIRNALALIGMDIPDPYKLGPLKDSAVAWDLIEGKPIVEFVGEVSSLPEPTDENGESPIDIEGRKQTHLIPDWAFPMKKEAEVEARVQLVRPSMRGDFIEAIDNAPLTSILSILKVPAGMIERSTLLSPFSYPFEVIDWKVKLELYFDSQIDMYNGREYYHVQSTVPIDLDYDSQTSPRFATILLGEAPLKRIVTHFLGPQGACDAESFGSPGTLQVVGEVGSQRMLGQEPVHINLGLTISGGLEQIIATCPRGSAAATSGQWRGYFLAAHQNELRDADANSRSFQIQDWTPVNTSTPEGGSVIARKTYDRPFGPGGHETTVIELRIPPDAQGEE